MRTLTAALMASAAMWAAIGLIDSQWNFAIGFAAATLIGVGSSVKVEFRG